MRRLIVAWICLALGFGMTLGACTSANDDRVPVEDIEVTAPGLQLDPEEIPEAAEMESLAKEILDTPTSEADAIALIESQGFIARVTERDGEPLPTTMDYRTNRFNLIVAQDVVRDLTVG